MIFTISQQTSCVIILFLFIASDWDLVKYSEY